MTSYARDSNTIRWCGLAIALVLLLGACVTQGPRSSSPDDPSPAEQIIDLPGGKAAYIDSGGPGVPVVFLHSDSLRGWVHQLGPLTSAGYRFIAIDFRDRSRRTPQRVEDYVARVDGVVAKLGLAKFLKLAMS